MENLHHLVALGMFYDFATRCGNATNSKDKSKIRFILSNGKKEKLLIFNRTQSTLMVHTLKSLINEHACLTILKFFSTLLDLIRVCSLNYFQAYSYPALLL